MLNKEKMKHDNLSTEKIGNRDLDSNTISFYGKIGATKITIRRANDNALLTIDLSTDNGKKEAELFCKDTYGYLQNKP
jgi:hypothetical protein